MSIAEISSFKIYLEMLLAGKANRSSISGLKNKEGKYGNSIFIELY